MTIKPPSRKHRVIAKKKAQSAHWWLIEDKPKTNGRLGQLNKHNRLRRKAQGPSEFILAAKEAESHVKSRR